MSFAAVQQILPPAQLSPSMAPTAASDTDSEEQTAEDVFTCSAFVTVASQLPGHVTGNYDFEVQIQREIQPCNFLSEHVRTRYTNPLVDLMNLLLGMG